MATLPNINNAGPKMPDEDFGKSEREEEKNLVILFPTTESVHWPRNKNLDLSIPYQVLLQTKNNCTLVTKTHVLQLLT